MVTTLEFFSCDNFAFLCDNKPNKNKVAHRCNRNDKPIDHNPTIIHTCAVFPRAEFRHLAGLLRPPQCLPPVRTGCLDPGEDGPSGATGRRPTEARGAGQPGGGAP